MTALRERSPLYRRGMFVGASVPPIFLCRPGFWPGCYRHAGDPATSRGFMTGNAQKLAASIAHRHDRRMADVAILESPSSQRESHWRVIWRNAFPFLVVAA